MRENYQTNKNTTLSHDVVKIVLGAPHCTTLCSYIKLILQFQMNQIVLNF